MPPGPELAALLASIDRAALSSGDLLRLAQARNRLVAHQQAQLLADLHAVAHTTPDRGAQPGRRESGGKYPWAEVDVAFALTWTAVKAGAELEFSDEVVVRLPQVFAALTAGEIDRPKAYVIANAVATVDDEIARSVVDQVIDRAPRLTTGQLAAKLRRLVIAADPAAASKRARQEIKGRRVQAFATEANLAALCGYELAPHRVAAAMERMTAIARAVKAAGDPRRIDQLRADILLDLLVGEGVAVGAPVTDGDLGQAPRADQHGPQSQHGQRADQHRLRADQHRPQDQHGQRADQHRPRSQHRLQADQHRPRDQVVTTAADASTPWPDAPADPTLALPDPPDGGGDLPICPQAPDPGDESIDPDHEQLLDLWYAGFGNLPTARTNGASMPPAGDEAPTHNPGAAEPHAGELPGGRPTASAAAAAMPGPRRGVVDLQVPLTTLVGLTELPGELEGWGPVIADIARQVVAEQPDAVWRFSVYDRLGELAHHGITRARPADPRPADPRPDGRRPAAKDSAFVKARDRTCRAPGCRRAARHCDLDHTVDWVHSKDSRRCNLACLCRKHHLFKHSHGAELVQLSPGVLGWITPTGMRYVSQPDPYLSELEPPELSNLVPTAR
jgi:hypothetical protein